MGLVLELSLLSCLSWPQVLHLQNEGLGWNGVYLVATARVWVVWVDYLQPTWALLKPRPSVVIAPWRLGLLLTDLLNFLSDTKLLDSSPDLLLLCDPFSVSWEHSPLHSAVQATGFLAASTLSYLTYCQAAWQSSYMRGLESPSLALNPGSHVYEP